MTPFRVRRSVPRSSGPAARTLTRAAVLGAVGAALVLPLAGSGAQAAPAAPRAERAYEAVTAWGSTPQVPWVVNGELRDGSQRIDLGLQDVYRVQRTSGGWLVVGNEDSSGSRAFLVRPDGSKTKLAGFPATLAVSENGRRVAKADGEQRTKVTLHRQKDGKVIAARTFRFADVLAVRGNRVLVSVSGRAGRTLWWNPGTDSTRRVIKKPAISADLSADRLELLDPSGGPCDRTLVQLSRPRRVIAELGNLAPTGWNATGDAMLLDECYFDEPYSRLAVVKTDPGYRTLARVDSDDRGGDRFGRAVWESRKTWLRVRFDEKRTFVERCNKQATRCERATRRWPSDIDPIDGALRSPQIVLGTLF